MKKVLFGTTAIVAAAFAGQALANGSVKHHDGVTLTVGGYFVAGVGTGPLTETLAITGAGELGGTYAGNTNTHGGNIEKDFHIINDGEIHFKAKGTLDNGIGIEVRVELEAGYAEDGADNQIDEHWMKVKTAFGTVMIGSNDTAVDNVAGGIGRMKGGIAGGSWARGYEFVPGATGYHLGDEGDGFGIHYYSPNISGFEFGVSWQPDTGTGQTVRNTGISTNGSQTNSNDQWAIGASYAGTLGDVDFVIGGGYVTSEQDGIANRDTEESIGGGIELGFGAITIGGAYLAYEEENFANGGDTEHDFYGAGIEYENGPWIFGLSGFAQEVDGAAATDDYEGFVINAAVGYELGDGVNVGLGLDYGEVDFDAAGQQDQEALGGLLLLGVKF